MRPFLFVPALVLPLWACATPRPLTLPEDVVTEPLEAVAAYDTTREVYARCAESFQAARTPWQAVVGGAAGAAGLAGLGAAVAVPYVITGAGVPAPAHAPAMTVGVLAGVAVGSIGAVGATYFGYEAFRAAERADVHGSVLDGALDEAARAAGESDPQALTALAVNLREDCAIVEAARSRPKAESVLRDLARRRRELRAEGDREALATAERAALASAKAGLEGTLDETRAELLRLRGIEEDLRARTRLLEGDLAERGTEARALRTALRKLEDEQASLSIEKRRLLDEKRLLEEKTGRYEEVARALSQEVEQGRVALRRLRDGMVVEMQNQVLFPSGSAELNVEGRQTLERVANAIRGTLSDRRVRVEGHTDNVPTGARSTFPSNWELSAARALTITRFLQDQGIDPGRLSAEARSEYAPMAPNATAEGRAKNRRIEIFLVPEGEP